MYKFVKIKNSEFTQFIGNAAIWGKFSEEMGVTSGVIGLRCAFGHEQFGLGLTAERLMPNGAFDRAHAEGKPMGSAKRKGNAPLYVMESPRKGESPGRVPQ